MPVMKRCRNDVVTTGRAGWPNPPFGGYATRRGEPPRPTGIHARRIFTGLLILFFCSTTFGATNEVARGLNWLATQQRADGSWSTNTALNALPVLAFLSAGNLPTTPGNGAIIDRGVRYILTQQTAEGAFTNGGARMYGHGVTTLLLAEVTGMVKRETGVRPRLTKAVELILRTQAVPKGDIHAGGWHYAPDSTDSDLAVTVWQVAALRAALNAGLRVPREALNRAAHYIQRCAHPRGGFGDQPGGFPNPGRTAAAVLALRMCGRYETKVEIVAPVALADEYFYHANFFCAQIGRGFNRQLLLKLQNADGSWSLPTNSPDEAEAGPLFTTSLAILALTTDEHYLPVFSVTD